jgi:hypothetical protein
MERVRVQWSMASPEAMTPATTAGEVAFEVERFEWTAADRLEVEGRWFGLRGHRFMRPALVVEAGDDRRRMLALLEHKPWAAGDGDPWTAAFTWEGRQVDVESAELSVAPSLAVELPPVRVPGAKGKRTAAARKKPARTPPRLVAHTEGRSETLARELAAARAEVERLEAEREQKGEARRRELAELRSALGAARSEVGELRGALEQAEEREARVPEEPLARAVAAEAARDEAQARLGELEAALEIARAELDQARTEQGLADEAEQASVAALERERDEAVRARQDALRARDASRRERNELVQRVDAAVAGRDAAARAREEALTERDGARRELMQARAELEQARSEVERARAERDAAVADHAADPPVDRLRRRPAAASPAVARARDDEAPGWGPRLVALAPLIALVVVLALLLRGVV